jgi:hypothetical protein
LTLLRYRLHRYRYRYRYRYCRYRYRYRYCRCRRSCRCHYQDWRRMWSLRAIHLGWHHLDWHCRSRERRIGPSLFH